MTEKQQKLVEDNHSLIYAFLNKYHFPSDEYYDVAAIGLCQAAISFDEGVSVFATYAYQCMFTSVCRELRKKKRVGHIPDDKILYYESTMYENNDSDTAIYINYMPSNENVENNTIVNITFDNFKASLNKEEHKQIIELLRCGYTQVQIAESMGCAQSTISGVKKKLLQYFER